MTSAARPQTPFIGLGVEVDPYIHPVAEQRWQTILGHLTAMRPGFFRVMLDASSYCSGFDRSGQPMYRWNDSKEDSPLHSLYQILDFAQQQHIEVYLGEWAPPSELGIHSPADPRWPKMIADFLDYLVHQRHYTQLHHVIYMNEPNGSWMWRGASPDFAAWATGVQALRQQLDQLGLTQITLTGPDTSGSPEWFAQAAKDLSSEFGAWEQHIYATNDQVSSGALERQLLDDARVLARADPLASKKTRFVAESGLVTGKIEAADQQPRVRDFEYGARMADYVVQVARAGWAGADAWDLDDAMHENGHGGLKVWGFLDSSSDRLMTPRPWYQAWAMLSHALPRGAWVEPLQGSPGSSIRAVAAHWASGSAKLWSLVLVNHSDAPTHVEVDTGPATAVLTEFRYFDSEQFLDSHQEPRPAACLHALKGRLRLELPSRGFLTVSTTPCPKSPSASDAHDLDLRTATK